MKTQRRYHRDLHNDKSRAGCIVLPNLVRSGWKGTVISLGHTVEHTRLHDTEPV